ncbi:MAG TPA: site-specific DNA-methyltransferase [Chitinophagales bacterium]|nr:site-specific DNA-methyltransferase [Chitinophagales bacterium]
MDIAQKIIEAHKLNFGSLPPLQQCSVSGSALINADCMDILPFIPDKSVQLILADLPYNVTGLKWDSILPLDKLWEQYERIIKDNGAIVLTAMQPFTTELIISNRKLFKYTWVWNKVKPGNFLTAKLKPMQNHEDIVVFSKANTANCNKNNMLYIPQLEKREKVRKYKKEADSDIYARKNTTSIEYTTDFKYPKSIIEISNANQKNKTHPTQKPLELMKYLIKTYSNENDYVLDNTMGVGTTCLGAKELNRRFIGIEKEVKYYELAVARVFGQHCH